MKHSAGILVYKREGTELKLLLLHPGGPFNKKDRNGWNFPKGGFEPGESSEATARREFQEETYLLPPKDIRFFGSFQTTSDKIVDVWIGEVEDYDLTKAISSCCEVFYHGETITVPEADDWKWFSVKGAYDKICWGQKPIIKAIANAFGICETEWVNGKL